MKAIDRTAYYAEYARFRLERKLFGERDFFARAERAWQIAPSEAFTVPSAIMLDGEFDRIIEIDPCSNQEMEKLRVFGGSTDCPPVMGYQFRDAILHQGSIIAAGAERRIAPFEMAPLPAKDFDIEREDTAALAGSYLGLKYFGHFMHDDAPLSLLAAEYGESFSPGVAGWTMAGNGETHIGAYAEFLELPFRHAEKMRCKALFMFDDERFTPHKGKRLRTLRARAREKLSDFSSAPRAFVRRGRRDKGIRRFVNEDEVAGALSAEGFAIVEPAEDAAHVILERLADAELVIGMEGSNLGHVVYTIKSGGGMIAITPPRRFASIEKDWADHSGVRYGVFIGDPAEEGFTCDIDRLRRLIDLF